MRCTVCGCDIEPNRDCCQNCGTRLIEMGVNTVPNVGGFQQMPSQRSKGFELSPTKRNVIVLIITLVTFIAAFGIYEFKQNTTKQYNIENFTVTLPRNLNEDTSVSADIDSDSTKSLSLIGRGKYANIDMDFQYLVYNYSGDTSTISEDTFLMLCETELISSLNSYEEISLAGNKLKCSYASSSIGDVYSYIVCKKSGDRFYVFVFGSSLLDRPDYEKKFENWANSIKIY